MYEHVKYVWEAYNGKHVMTMRKATPEWCNADCPTISVIDSKPSSVEYHNISGFRVNSGLCSEALPDEIRNLFIQFVVKSSEAYYRKYQCLKEVNGFVSNLTTDNKFDLKTQIMLDKMAKMQRHKTMQHQWNKEKSQIQYADLAADIAEVLAHD